MLKHYFEHHSGEKLEEMRFGAMIVKPARTAFNRQVCESVQIQENAAKHEIVNSKSEYNNCTLPRLVTRNGDPDKDFKEYEKEQKVRKEKDDKIEEEIRNLRKSRNKARMRTEKGQPAQKRRKMEEENYISIRETWGQPKTTSPKKTNYQQFPQIRKR